MKTKLKLVSRMAFIAVTAGALAFGSSNAFGQATREKEGPPNGTSSMAGVGQKPRKSDKKANTTATTAGGQLSQADRSFVEQAAKGGMHEVEMGQMGQQHGQSDDVKKLAAMIVTDHTKANNELMGMANAHGIKPDTRHKMDKMSKKDMENFDSVWIVMMINDHKKDIADFERQAQSGTDPQVRDFAKKTTPVLKKHLQMAEAAQKKMGKNGGAAKTDSAKKSGQ